MKELIDKTDISNKIQQIGILEGKSNNRISAISIFESFGELTTKKRKICANIYKAIVKYDKCSRL